MPRGPVSAGDGSTATGSDSGTGTDQHGRLIYGGLLLAGAAGAALARRRRSAE